MTKASVLIDDAMQMLGVSSYMMPADPAQQQRVFTTLKRLFYSLPTKSIYLPMRRPATLAAELREPAWATEALVAVLAHAAAPYFPKAEMNPSAADLYVTGTRMLQRKTRRPTDQVYDQLVPTGSGNCNDYYSNRYFYPGDNVYQYSQYDERNVGEVQIYNIDFTDEASQRNTTVSSVEWAQLGSISLSISSETLVGDSATAMLSFQRPGVATVRCRATFASGEVYDGIIEIAVREPEAGRVNVA